MTVAPEPALEAFIPRWAAAGGSERANYQLFVNELCELLGVPKPDPARHDTRDDAYVFERRVTFQHGDGTETAGFMDLYRRSASVLEAKKLRRIEGKGFDDAMLRARSQAEQYARALPAAEGRPPFLLIVCVGNVIELYAEFTRSGATYVPFPDPRSHRIRLSDLRRADPREWPRQVWLDPLGLDASRRSARVTREIAAKLAEIANAGEIDKPNARLRVLMPNRAQMELRASDLESLLPEGTGAHRVGLRRAAESRRTVRRDQSRRRRRWTLRDCPRDPVCPVATRVA